MKRIIVNMLGAAAFSGGILMAGIGSAAAAPQGIPLESAPVADSGSSAGNLLAGILGTGSAAIKCMAGGGDWSSFPRSADGPMGCLPSGYGISATSGGATPADSIADPGTGSASGSAQLLLKCLTSGSSVAPGDQMGFPAICR
ncbi:hypothetical protein OHB26_14270 [Nocardia sp. NBC_01503]|uniref:hypothetical protein n=1 Tax=Nocardia sp. NBC_01503 TaxID=2975997 RepID=UPI002E7B5F11|nr:hypothetical protein [Nocardia sp. NBC_01503]WTL35253.1 hypothetical protein OHB26_14270 [Nocardia sp. NBC_01503]